MQNEEQGWINLTDKIIEHGFGEDSSTGSQFNHAKWAGQHRINMSEGEIQRNYDLRIEAFEAMLKSSIAELELVMELKPAGTRVPAAVVSDSRQVF
jgi:hypothetical protein